MFHSVRSTRPARQRRPQRPKRPRNGRDWPMAPLAVASIAVLSLAAAGCSTANASVPADKTQSATSLEAARVDELLFGAMDPSSEQAQKLALEEQARYDEAMTRCMAAAGFEYYPYVADVVTYEEDDGGYFSREYAETYGFGYTTTIEDSWSYSYESVDEQADMSPSDEYLSSLTPAEQDAYYLAMYGDQSVWETIESDEQYQELLDTNPELFGPAGCEAEAQSPASRAMNEVWNTYGDELNEIGELAQTHPTVLPLIAEWRDCMADQGHILTDPDDFDTIMDPYVTEIYATLSFPADSLTDEDYETMSQEELDAIFSSPPTYDADLLAEAQDYERALAVASWDCGMTDLYDGYQAAYTELRQQFVESHLGELTALLEG